MAHPTASFLEIVEKIAVTHHHRVFLVGEDHHPVGLISVADICKLLELNLFDKKAPPPVPTRR